ncbi:MAG: hypothetical protein HC835_02330 [Oscillatoriales cyanobacterium RM2_1_1]|nr:hypothetical protein [Oscillatoriales cyanobacterium RM2_1_1]
MRTSHFERWGDRFVAAIGLGLVTLCVVLLATSLVFPLSPVIGAVVAILFVSLAGIPSKTRQDIIQFLSILSPGLMLGCFGLAIVTATFTSQKIVWFDTGLYHFGSIRWLSEFGTVPGVALINAKFGFTSSWFALAAPLVPNFLGSRVGAVTNGFIFFIATLQIFITLTHIRSGNSRFSDWFLSIATGVTVLVYFLTAVTGAPILISFSADIAITFLVITTAWSILIISENRNKYSLVSPPSTSPFSTSPHLISPHLISAYPSSHYGLDSGLIPLILSIGAVTIKLSALPLLGIGFFYFIFAQSSSTNTSIKSFQYSRVILALLVIALGLLPMLAVAVTTSGCPLYPSTALCFDVPWLITENQRIVANEVNDIRFWWKLNNPEVFYSSILTPTARLLNWFLSSRESQAMTLSIIISGFGIPWSLFRSNRHRIPGQSWIIALGLLGIIFIMTQSPLLRFGLGYFVLVPALITASISQGILSWLSGKKNQRINLKGINSEGINPEGINSKPQQIFPLRLTFISLFLASLTLIILISGESRNRLILPPELPKTKLLVEQVNDVQYFRPDSRALRCWAAKLPCASVPVYKSVRLRHPDQGIGGGFMYGD